MAREQKLGARHRALLENSPVVKILDFNCGKNFWQKENPTTKKWAIPMGKYFLTVA